MVFLLIKKMIQLIVPEKYPLASTTKEWLRFKRRQQTMKNLFKLFTMIITALLVSSAANASTTTFDLNLSYLSSEIADLSGIYSLGFSGTPKLTEGEEPNTFTESGKAYLSYYKTSAEDEGTDIEISNLYFKFEALTGSYIENEDGITSISFDPDQYVFLNYGDTEVARFALLPGSGGDVLTDTSFSQAYYLSLVSGVGVDGLFGTTTTFLANIGAFNFSGDYYVMAGELKAVPVPGSFLLIGSGLILLACSRRRA